MIALRKDSEESDVIAYGDIEPLAQKDPFVFAYRRTYEGHELTRDLVANFYGKEYQWKNAPDLSGFKKVLGNYENTEIAEDGTMNMKPYEAAVWVPVIRVC